MRLKTPKVSTRHAQGGKVQSLGPQAGEMSVRMDNRAWETPWSKPPLLVGGPARPPRVGFLPLESGIGSGLFRCLTKLGTGMLTRRRDGSLQRRPAQRSGGTWRPRKTYKSGKGHLGSPHQIKIFFSLTKHFNSSLLKMFLQRQCCLHSKPRTRPNSAH